MNRGNYIEQIKKLGQFSKAKDFAKIYESHIGINFNFPFYNLQFFFFFHRKSKILLNFHKIEEFYCYFRKKKIVI